MWPGSHTAACYRVGICAQVESTDGGDLETPSDLDLWVNPSPEDSPKSEKRKVGANTSQKNRI